MVSILFAILILLGFYRITSFEAFVELKSSALGFQFVTEPREMEIVDFGAGATILDAAHVPTLETVKGGYLRGISTLSRDASLRFEAFGPKSNRATLCLLRGRYSLSIRDPKGRHDERVIDVPADDARCLDVVITNHFLALPRRMVIEPRADSRGVETYPDMIGKLRIRDTDKELAVVSGMRLHVLLEEKPATSIAFTDGHFGVSAWKKIQVLWSDRGDLAKYYFTPLDLLKKYAEENGLWYSISLLIGIVFGVRKLLSLD